MIRLHSGGENALALRALRGDLGDARELLATTRGRPMDDDSATRRARIEELRTIAAREFQLGNDKDAQIQRIEIEIQRLAGERDAHDARARRTARDAARLEGR